LKRIEEGTYGICLISGREIAHKRLNAIPWAKYTIEVQKKIERGEEDDERQHPG
jgi:DnaK suppressor protein